MQFVVKRDSLLKSLNFVQGVVEKKNTLPILSNVLLQLKENKLFLVATDLDLIFHDEIKDVKIIKEGSTTTSAAILYDILRKISSNSELNFELKSENKLSLKSENSDFNLLCLPTDNFPSFSDKFDGEEIYIDNKKFLNLLNKTRISISNDDTRHYLNGIYLHLTEAHGRTFLTGVATDSHRLSSSSLEIDSNNNFSSLILPRKTVFQLCSLLTEISDQLIVTTSETKIKFKIGNIQLVSKVIDGKFPDYKKVVPIKNEKKLVVSSKDFVSSIERTAVNPSLISSPDRVNLFFLLFFSFEYLLITLVKALLNPRRWVPPSFCGILFVKGNTSSEYPAFHSKEHSTTTFSLFAVI